MDARNNVVRLKARQEAANQTVTAKFQNITKLLEEEVDTPPPQSNPTLDYLESLVGKLKESPEHDTHYRLRRLHTRFQDSRSHSSSFTESRATATCVSTDLSRPYSQLLNTNLILQQEEFDQKSALVHPMMPPQPILHIVEPEKENKNEPTPTPPPSTNDLDVQSIPLLV